MFTQSWRKPRLKETLCIAHWQKHIDAIPKPEESSTVHAAAYTLIHLFPSSVMVIKFLVVLLPLSSSKSGLCHYQLLQLSGSEVLQY